MPNWVENNIVIRGNKEDLLHLQQRVSAPVVVMVKHETYKDTGMYQTVIDESPFSFYNVVSPLVDGFHPDNFDWYQWRNENWGTKWDASDPECGEIEPSPVGRLDSSHNLTYSFRTAWSPPCTVLAELSRLYPNLEIHNRWTEEQGFGEEVIYQNGERTIIDSWDIPEWEQEEEENET